MIIATDKEILAAAQKCSDDYRRELEEREGVHAGDTIASWKEIVFFIKGVMWAKEHYNLKEK